MEIVPITKSDIEYLISEIELMPSTEPRELISEYAAEKRILPPNTPFPGPFDNDKTPYLVEIMDNMSPFSPVSRTAVMKGCQIGLTTACENILGYWMDEYPAEIMYISATTTLLDIWSSKRLEPLIDSCGFRHKIKSNTENKGSRKTGDKIFVKEFVGGTLNLASAQSASSLRSDSKRLLLRDEVDGAPAELTTGEGNWIDVSTGRTSAYGDRAKILDISTPTTIEKSLIYPIYEKGDQRKYNVPCPHCNEKQVLKFGNDKSNYGVKPVFEDDVLVDAYYECEHCHEDIYEYHKAVMLRKGKWKPTAKSEIENFRSYHLSSLYSPIGMLSWKKLYEHYLEAKSKPDGMRSFVNLYLGEVFKEIGIKPSLSKLLENIGEYRHKTVPHGVLYLTAGIDVQRGSEKDSRNQARLEMEVLGHGAGYKTWSIFYERFEGAVDDPYEGAWKKLDDWAKDGGFIFKRKDSVEFQTQLVFIDSGDGNLTDVVYRFTTRYDNIFPSKGFSALKKRKTEKGDEAGPSNFKKYRAQKIREGMFLYEMSTNYYKKHLYHNLAIPRQETGEQKAGFCDFPRDYTERYFKQLTAEEKRIDGSFHCPSGTRNEAMDCRVMNLCAGDVWLDNKLYDYRAERKANGAKPNELSQINHMTVLEMLNRIYGVASYRR